MARKKPRTIQPSASTITLEQKPPALASASLSTLGKETAAIPSSFRQTPLGWLLWRLFRMASSLQLAIILLTIFATTLAIATKFEEWYSTSIVQNVIYRTWWFSLLLCLLAVNILCAALKKYPWKKYQTGFLITHIGLEVLVFGGLLTALFGVEGVIDLIDSSDAELQERTGTPQVRHSMALNDMHSLEVAQVKEGDLQDRKSLEALQTLVQDDTELTAEQVKYLGSRFWQVNFNPGSFVWHSDQYITPRLPLGLKMLKVLADPFPHFRTSLGSQGDLVVENFYPYTEAWPVSDASSEGSSFPALRVQMKVGERSQETWVLGRVPRMPSQLELNLDMMELTEPALLPEFLDPPSNTSRHMGKDGQLVVAVGSGKDARLFRIPVDRDHLAQSTPLPGTDLEVRLIDWDHLSKLDDAEGHTTFQHQQVRRSPEEYPTLKLEVTGPQGQATYLACARLPHRSGLISGTPSAKLSFWYHYPDFRWGRAKEDAPETLQFLQGPEGKVYYRFYAGDELARKGKPIDLDNPDEAYRLPSDPLPITFQVTAHKPQAVYKPSYVPKNVAPGIDSETLQPALRFTMTVPDKNGKSVSEMLWVRMGTSNNHLFDVAGNKYVIRYRKATELLDFSLRLNRAREVKDPGSNRSAAFESEVTLIVDDHGKKETSDHRIYMNHTLDYGRYKVYQMSYMPVRDGRRWVEDRTTHRAVSRSGLQVAYDPGLLFKYAGSLIVVAGIVVMFYMKAYLFKPRGGARVRPADLDADPTVS